MYLAVIVATSLLSHSYAMLISIFFIHNSIAALITGALLFVPFFIFSGFIIPINKLPYYVRPFTYSSIYKLAIESVLIIFYGFNLCDTKSNSIDYVGFVSSIDKSLFNVSSCISETTSIPSLKYIVDSFNNDFKKIDQSLILSRFGLNNLDLFINFSLICLYILILRILAYIILKYKTITK